MMDSRCKTVFLLCCLGFLLPALAGAENYDFNLDEFEKKALTWGGYAELKGEHLRLNRGGVFGVLGYYDDPRSSLDRLTTTLSLDGNFNQGSVDFNWLLQAWAEKDQLAGDEDLSVFSAYASIKPAPSVTFELGKKTFKWGKGYAWNPVGFISRPKDPNNPEDALEGYIGAGVDLIKSYPGKLQTLALTGVLLPVWDDVNEDFGARNHLNFAVKLYSLYRDMDIDLIFFSGGGRSTRFGIDVAKNLARHFEVHAELAHIPEQKITVLNSMGSPVTHEQAATSYLLGLRYLSESNMTTILEYYHHDAGYSERELERFYRLAADAYDDYLESGNDTLLQQAATVGNNGYAKPQAGRNYLYLRITRKEPFNLLYFTPGVTAILNLDDSSRSISPEAVYTGFTNWEFRLRYAHLEGGRFTEYGEKLNEDKVELRVRYYF